MSQRLSKKIFNICIIIVIIVAIIFVALMMILNYAENGETNMPFNLSKITIISTVDGKDVGDETNRWNLQVNQNNDIYIYIAKNENYKKTQTIKSVTINNFNIKVAPGEGNITIYKPSVNEVSIFKNLDENIAQEIVINGDTSTDIQNLKISNQGGIVAFRCANNNLGTYISNDDEEINYKNLLGKMNINEESLRTKITFDMAIELNSGTKFKAESIEVEIPIDDITKEGTTSLEITNLDSIIFKRI